MNAACNGSRYLLFTAALNVRSTASRAALPGECSCAVLLSCPSLSPCTPPPPQAPGTWPAPPSRPWWGEPRRSSAPAGCPCPAIGKPRAAAAAAAVGKSGGDQQRPTGLWGPHARHRRRCSRCARPVAAHTSSVHRSLTFLPRNTPPQSTNDRCFLSVDANLLQQATREMVGRRLEAVRAGHM